MERTASVSRRDSALSAALPFVAAVLLLGSAGEARADDQTDRTTVPPPPTDSKKIEILVTPYLFLPWTSVGVHPVNPQLPSASTTISPDKMIRRLTWVPFMGAAEIRGGSFGVVVDYIHAPLTGTLTTRDILFGGGSTGLGIDTGSAKVLYRPISGPDQYLDVGAGFRAWGFNGGVSLEQGRLPPVSVSAGASWVDPLIAARYHHELGNGFGATADGDVGGFGAGANIDWQLIGTLDYKHKSWPTLHVGFRTLNFNYQGARARFDTSMYGPFLATTFQF
jgi:hypothetical protein